MSVSGHQVLNIIEMRKEPTKLRFSVSWSLSLVCIEFKGDLLKSFIFYRAQLEGCPSPPKTTNFTPLHVVWLFCLNNEISRYELILYSIQRKLLLWFDQVKIESSELKWQFMRASGAGGQGVNTADSAVSKLFYEDDIGLQHLTLPNRGNITIMIKGSSYPSPYWDCSRKSRTKKSGVNKPPQKELRFTQVINLHQLSIFFFRCRTRQQQWRSSRTFCIKRNSTRTCLLYQQTESFRSILLS